MRPPYNRVRADNRVRCGRPGGTGTRSSVADVLGLLGSGVSEQDLLDDFPQLSHDDVLACMAYAAERERALVVTALQA